MNHMIIRHMRPNDLEACMAVDTSGVPAEAASSRETIKLRMDTFLQGFPALAILTEFRKQGIAQQFLKAMPIHPGKVCASPRLTNENAASFFQMRRKLRRLL